MSPLVGTSSDLAHDVTHTGRIEHVPAACERTSVCRGDCGPVRGTACFERGPVPFADFLYHENRKLEIEIPDSLPSPAALQESGIEPDSTASRPDVGPARDAVPTGDRAYADGSACKISARSAIVLNLARPQLVARFIDLYA